VSTAKSRTAELVTIAVPIYNGGKYLAECIDSVFNQTYQHIELILVDNASSDNTSDVIRKYRERSSAIIHQRNPQTVSMADNWNIAVSLASGQYLKLLPCDDVLTPYCIERQVYLLNKHTEAMFTSCAKRLITADGRPKFKKSGLPTGLYSGPETAKRCFEMISNPLGEPPSILFHLARLQQEIEYDPKIKYFTDLDLLVTIMSSGGKIYHTDEALYYYRLHKASETVRLRKEILHDYIRMLDKHKSKLGVASSPLHFRYLKIKLRVISFLRNAITDILIRN
jgi:glycosyltransferase involved in cell wall biosynthesis